MVVLVVAAVLVVPAGATAKRSVYVSNFQSNNVSAFNVNADRSLTPVAGSPFAAGVTGLEGVVMTPDDAHLYVLSSSASTMGAFNVAADGSLSPVAGSPFAIGGSGGGFMSAVAPDGGHLYVANSDSISALTIAAAAA